MRLGMRKKSTAGKVVSFAVIVAIIICSSAFFLIRATPVFKLRAVDAATQEIRKCIDETAAEVLKSTDMFEVSALTDNGSSVIDMNTLAMNELRNSFSANLAERLKKTYTTQIYISLGSLINCPPLQGVGMKIPVKIYFGTISKVDITDEFLSGGINQTKYRANLEITVSAAVISAFMCDTRDINVTLPICERIFIGNVPNYYIGRNGA